MIEAYQV